MLTAPPTSTQKPVRVSVLIPVWNGRKHLHMVMSSLHDQTTRDFDVTVIDNGSTDGTISYLDSEWPEVRIIRLHRNTGFAIAANRGIAATSGTYVAFVNDDMELEPSWIEQLAGELDSDYGLGMVTGKVMFDHDRSLIYQAGHEFYEYGWCATRGVNETDSGQYDERLPTVAGTGAGSMYRRTALEQAGGFDGDYFMYCEDVDLGLRVLLAGYRGLYVPRPVAWHVAGASNRETPENPRRMLYRNQFVTLLKNVPARILVPALPKVLRYARYQYEVERINGSPEVALDAYTEFVRMLPRTLLKRREVRRRTVISPAEFQAQIRSDFPFPRRLPKPARAGGGQADHTG